MYYLGHHQLVMYTFLGLSIMELFALLSACVLKCCSRSVGIDDTIELGSRGEIPGGWHEERDTSVLDAMKAKYRQRKYGVEEAHDDPQIRSGLLGYDSDEVTRY